MATQQFNSAPPPARANRWQDWANLILAIWLFISPWVLQFARGRPATAPGARARGAARRFKGRNPARDGWVLGVIIFLVAVSAVGRMAASQERINLILGIWLFIAP